MTVIERGAGKAPGQIPLVEAMGQVSLPPDIARRRDGESDLDYTLRTLAPMSEALDPRSSPQVTRRDVASCCHPALDAGLRGLGRVGAR